MDLALQEWLEKKAFLCVVSLEGPQSRAIYGYLSKYNEDVIAVETNAGLIIVDRKTIIKIRETKPKC